MIAETMMMGGMAILIASDRPRIRVNPLPGDILREAFRAPIEQPLPPDMQRIADRLARPVYLVGGKDMAR